MPSGGSASASPSNASNPAGRPGMPRHERMHRPINTEATRPASANIVPQQAKFDALGSEFDTERPHEAFAMKVPKDFDVP